MVLLTFKFLKKSKSVPQLFPFCADFRLFFVLYIFVSFSLFSVMIKRSRRFNQTILCC